MDSSLPSFCIVTFSLYLVLEKFVWSCCIYGLFEKGNWIIDAMFLVPFFGHLVNVSLDAFLRRKPLDWSHVQSFSVNLDMFECFWHHSDI